MFEPVGVLESQIKSDDYSALVTSNPFSEQKYDPIDSLDNSKPHGYVPLRPNHPNSRKNMSDDRFPSSFERQEKNRKKLQIHELDELDGGSSMADMTNLDSDPTKDPEVLA